VSDTIQHINVDDDQWDGTPSALRDHVKRLQKELKSRDEQISSLRDQQTSAVLSDVLAGFKNPERVKRDLISDKVDPLDSEAVTEWMKSNADDYARSTGSADNPQEDQQQELPDQRRLNAPGEQGQPAGSNKLAELDSMPADLSPQQTAQWLIDHGF
jgi:hypothetical protein